MIIPAMGIITLSDRVFIMSKIPEFQVLGVLLTSPAIVPTLSLTSVNMVSKLVSTHPCNSSFMNSVILSMIPPMNYENSVVSCGITVCATIMMPPPLISCFMSFMRKYLLEMSLEKIKID